MLIFWNCLGLNYIFFYGLSSPIFLKTTAQSYPAQCFPDTGLSSPVIIWSESQKPWGSPAHFFQMGSLQPSPKLKWISNTLGLSSQFFFPNGLSPAQSKVEMNLKHLGCPARSKIEILQRPGGSQVSWFALSSKLFGLSSPVVFDSDFKSYGLSSPDELWVLQPKYQGAIQPKPPALFSSHSFLRGCAVCANFKKNQLV